MVRSVDKGDAGALQGVEFTRVPTLPFIVSAMEREIGASGVRRCFDAVGVHREVACAPGSVLPMRDLFGLFEWFARTRGDNGFGVFIGQSLRPDYFGPFATYAFQAQTLGSAIGRMIRALHLHQTCSTMALDVDAGIATWSYRVTLPLTLGRHHHALHVLVNMVGSMGLFLGSSPALIEVGIETERPRHGAHAEDKFAAPVRWRQPTNYIRFAAGLLAATLGRTPAANPITFSDLMRYARSVPPRTVSEKTEAALRICLVEGRVSIDAIAEYLNVGVRTLQRQLAAEGIAYSGLLEHARRRRAHELLTESDVPLWRIAEILCYSDPAHFTRAYRRWNGTAPNHLRRHRSTLIAG